MTASRFPRVRIEDLILSGEAELRTGPFGTQLKASEYREAGVPVINVRNFGNGELREEQLERVAPSTTAGLSVHLLKDEDIVFGRKGAVERHLLVRKSEQGWMQGTDCLRLRFSSERIIAGFASYYFRTTEHHQWMINQCSHGATMTSLNQDVLSRIEIPMPPVSVQRHIVTALSTYDDLIENNLRRIRILEEMARAIYREWFVHLRFPGHQGVKLVDSPLGPIPEGWEVKPLRDVCQLTMGQSPRSEFYNDRGEGLPFHQGVKDFGDRFPQDRVYCTAEGRNAEAGDILFSVRAPVGRMNIATKRIVIGRGLSAIRHKDGHQAFLWEQLKARFREEDMMGGGAIFAAVGKGELGGVELLCPAQPLLELASAQLQPIHDLIAILSAQVQNLRATRDVLLPRLVSGRLTLAEAAVPAAISV